MKNILVRVDDAVHAALRKKAYDENRSMSVIVREGIDIALNGDRVVSPEGASVAKKTRVPVAGPKKVEASKREALREKAALDELPEGVVRGDEFRPKCQFCGYRGADARENHLGHEPGCQRKRVK